MSSARRAALAGALLAVLSSAASVATAASPSPQPVRAPSAPAPESQGGDVTFGLQTSGRHQPDDRGVFSWSATPGATVSDFVAVSNVSVTPVRLSLYASDALNTAEGGFDVLPAATKPRDVGSWITLKRGELVLAARSKTIVAFTLRIPQDASPGDHTGGIVASLRTTRTDQQGNTIEVDQRVGARTYLRVAGPLSPKLVLESVATSYDAKADPRKGNATVTWRVRNTGNVRLSAEQALQLDPWVGSTRSVAAEAMPELLPGNSLDFSARIEEVPAGIRVVGRVRLAPVSPLPGAEGVEVAVEEAAAWAIPWLIVVGLLATALAYVARRWRGALPARSSPRRRRRALAVPAVDGPGLTVAMRRPGAHRQRSRARHRWQGGARDAV